MKENVGEVMAPGPQTEELAVQDMRQPGQRMPVGGVCAVKSPADALPRQAALDVTVFSDVKVVIIINEAVAQGREESAEHDQKEKGAEDRNGWRVERERGDGRGGCAGRIRPGKAAAVWVRFRHTCWFGYMVTSFHGLHERRCRPHQSTF